MGLTDKQRNILLENGWTEQDLKEVPYEEASDAIGKILEEQRSRPRGKVIRQPQTDFVMEKKGWQKKPYEKPAFDNKSYYVAYAKDLCIAMLQAHVEARKVDPKIEPIATEGLMHEAIRLITLAKRNNF